MRYRILIVDDEKMIRMGIKNAMPWEQMQIAEVYTASSAKEAAALIGEHRPQIMITDISMAEMSGLELVGQIREQDADMRVIVLTGYDRFEYARQALQLQVHDFLLKPIDEMELQKSILAQVEWLESKRIKEENSRTKSRWRWRNLCVRLCWEERTVWNAPGYFGKSILLRRGRQCGSVSCFRA